ncbi:MAG: translocation and assembly module TamB [Candidatus Tokpelaia sp. JSC188]|nr:MAG: translocation and assembly module TamB [Candidatus Tokpelaia sp. JSC188]
MSVLILLLLLRSVSTEVPSTSQNSLEPEKSWLLSLVERKLSSPNQQIRISNINASWTSVDLITVADRQGIWLKLSNAKLDWNFLALLTGYLSVNYLNVERIEVLRRPLSDISIKKSKTQGFSSLLNLPIAINIASFHVSQILFSKELFGVTSVISFDGNITLANGMLDFASNMKRLDGPKGNLNLFIGYSKKKQYLSLDLELSESTNGIGVNIMKIKNRPPVNFLLKGKGDLDNLDIDLLMKTPKNSALYGKFSLRSANKGRAFSIVMKGPIGNLILEDYYLFFGSDSSLNANGLIATDNSIQLHQLFFEEKSINAPTLIKNGITSLQIAMSGFYKDKVLNIATLDLTVAKNLKMKVSGHLPFVGNGLDLKANGFISLALVNQFFVGRNTQLSGILMTDASIVGSLADPHLNGSFSLANGQFVDPATNLNLIKVMFSGYLDKEQIIIQPLMADSINGGSINLAGSISINVKQGFPANLILNLNHAHYNDGNTFAAIVHGQITLTGPLIHNPIIAGDVLIEKAEINMSGVINSATMIEVHHKHLTLPIARTFEWACMRARKIAVSKQPSSYFVPRFNVQIRAPSRFFVRGYGLDVELGGQIHISGLVTDINPIGNFNVLRGRLDIMNQRLTLNEAQITLTGDMNPDLHFVARTENDGISLSLLISGTPDNISFNFQSQPELPQSEILSRLIFKRSVNELSPVQVALLVDTIAELTGVTNRSLVGKLVLGLGFDNFGIASDRLGNTVLQAGRYIRDNIYLGVESGSSGNRKGTINLDINSNLKFKGGISTNADSNFGIFYEKDY